MNDWPLIPHDPVTLVQDELQRLYADDYAVYARAAALFEGQIRACRDELERYDIAAFWLERLADEASLRTVCHD
jgi:uncharacterized membrane protein